MISALLNLYIMNGMVKGIGYDDVLCELLARYEVTVSYKESVVVMESLDHGVQVVICVKGANYGCGPWSPLCWLVLGGR